VDLKTHLKRFARPPVDLALLAYGMAHYLISKRIPLNERSLGGAYQSMIRLFCLTSGRSNDFVSRIISVFDKPLSLPDYHGVLGDYSKNDTIKIAKGIEENGFYIFEQKLPLASIDTIYQFSLAQECIVRKLDEEDINGPELRAFYDQNNPRSSVYDVPLDVVNSNQAIQNLLSDHSILGVAQSYLKSSPKVEPAGLTWSTAFSNKPQNNSAQLFHFDMDRFKWLKFFIFLTDVTMETGPHVFIQKSHKTGGIPPALLKAGYSRHTDESVSQYYSQNDIKTFIVPAGTIIAEDTRGLHKGTNLIKGDRLMLQLQFSNSLFGAKLPTLEDTKNLDSKFVEFARNYRNIFKLFPI
jgi:hypothetical protein